MKRIIALTALCIGLCAVVGCNLKPAPLPPHAIISGGAGNLTGTGTNNTANGYQALQANTTGYNNTAYGFKALAPDAPTSAQVDAVQGK